MSSHPEPLDISLLRYDKNAFLIRCQPIIMLTIKYYIAKNMFVSAQYNDLIQSVNERLIKRLDGIEKHFDGRVRMDTYISVVIRNICRTLYEIESQTIPLVQLQTADAIIEGESEKNLFLEDEAKHLSLIFDMYASLRLKIIIFMKIYYRLPLSRNEVNSYFRNLSRTKRNEIFTKFGGEYSNTYQADNFDFLGTVLFLKEGNLASGGSLRRWTERKINEIVILLNGNPPSRSFTPETVKLLFEYFVEHKSKKH